MPYVTVSSDLVSALPVSTVSRDELATIRDPRNLARYKGVYGHRHGGRIQARRYNVLAYRARVFKFFELGSNFPTPEDAARVVVAFCRVYCGDRWQQVLTKRRIVPWRIRAVRHQGHECYMVDVYVRGCPRGVSHADVFGRSPGGADRYWWPSRDAAKQAARAAMDRWFKRELPSLPIPAPGLLFWRA